MPSCNDPATQGTLRRNAMPDPALILREAYDTVRRDYGRAIGQQRDELITPALVLDIDAAQRNIDHMASELKQMGAATIRPSSGSWPSWPGIIGCSSPWTRPRTPRPRPRPPSRRGRRWGSWSRWTPAWTAAGPITQRTAWRWPGR